METSSLFNKPAAEIYDDQMRLKNLTLRQVR